MCKVNRRWRMRGMHLNIQNHLFRVVAERDGDTALWLTAPWSRDVQRLQRRRR